ncbi:MAG TPA: PDZ domain-containing protein, partial [Bacteroidota bacterium]|nr:PDZ domain-containing protein [Bacteroidota bacterium]
KNSAGEAAGLKAGDIILSVDGKKVDSPNALQSIVASHYPGDEVALRVFRDGKTIEKKVALKSMDESAELASNDEPESDDSSSKEPASSSKVTVDDLGLTVKALDAATKKSSGEEKGVVVDNVEPLGPANERGLVQGDVILSVGSQKIESPSQFQSALKKLKPGDAVMLRVKGSDKTVRYVAIEMPK